MAWDNLQIAPRYADPVTLFMRARSMCLALDASPNDGGMA
jgi:hypothetical protein